MSITIDLTPEIEQKLKQVAARAGLTPHAYVAETLRERLEHVSESVNPPQLSSAETKLLITINTSLSAIAWERYHELVARRQAEVLSDDEQQELIALTDQIEAANVVRVGAVAELAKLRGTSLDTLMATLGLKPQPYA
ncbi:MAG: hypothetical protein MUD01_27215 [Chloroflexaceae bacterium]|nr:hypothetical protein [Chloroflexaceae bacterium]